MVKYTHTLFSFLCSSVNSKQIPTAEPIAKACQSGSQLLWYYSAAGKALEDKKKTAGPTQTTQTSLLSAHNTHNHTYIYPKKKKPNLMPATTLASTPRRRRRRRRQTPLVRTRKTQSSQASKPANNHTTQALGQKLAG